MTTVEYFNGYEIFALCNSQSSETLSFNEFRAELSDGYRQQALYGSSLGTRSWNFSFKTLTGAGYNPSIDLDGIAMATGTYLMDLFVRTKTSGIPFIVKSPVNNQYYLAEFADSSLTFDRALVKLFSSGVNLRQVRLPGVYMFSPAQLSSVSHWYTTPITGATDNTALPGDAWANETGGDQILTFGTTTYQTNEQNGLSVVRLDQTSGVSYLSTDNLVPDILYEVFMVMKVREAAFSHDDGIIANGDGSAGSPVLIGTASDTKFYNLGFGAGYTYKKNGIQFAESNQQAPMNAFGLVHVRRDAGWTLPQGLVFGIDRITAFPNRKADIDIGEIIVASAALPESAQTDMTEYLMTKWGL
jgi:hypothetical protein